MNAEIVRYFRDAMFQRYQQFEQYTTYIANFKTYDETNRDKYVIVSVLNKDAYYDKARLSQLRWFSILCSDEVQVTITIRQQDLYRSGKDDDVSKDRILIASDRDYRKTVYDTTVGWPLKVVLLHNEKKKSRLQWPDALTLHQAIDTYKCLLKRTDF